MVERLHGMQEVREFDSPRLHRRCRSDRCGDALAVVPQGWWGHSWGHLRSAYTHGRTRTIWNQTLQFSCVALGLRVKLRGPGELEGSSRRPGDGLPVLGLSELRAWMVVRRVPLIARSDAAWETSILTPEPPNVAGQASHR